MEVINRNILSNDLITVTLLIGFVFVFVMKLYNPKHLLGYTTVFFSQGFIEKRAEENASLFTIFQVSLFFFITTVITVSLFTLIPSFYFEKNIINLLSIFIATSSYLICKQAISFILIHVFDIKEELIYFVYTKNSYLYTTCLLLFPVLIINQYLVNNSFFLLFFAALLLIIRAILIVLNNKNIIFNHIFYFILYFCALELSPLVILYKTIN